MSPCYNIHWKECSSFFVIKTFFKARFFFVVSLKIGNQCCVWKNPIICFVWRTSDSFKTLFFPFISYLFLLNFWNSYTKCPTKLSSERKLRAFKCNLFPLSNLEYADILGFVMTFIKMFNCIELKKGQNDGWSYV